MYKEIILGISGASGAVYARRLLDLFEKAVARTHVIFTNPGRAVFAHELALDEFSTSAIIGRDSERISWHDNANLFSPLASGSTKFDAMVICPCSSHTVAAVAAGLADTLLLRSAYVTLKQKRPLVLVHRETPVTAIDLENMLRITRAGGTICPACPPFYHHPRNIDPLIDALAARVLDLLGVDHNLSVRWSPPVAP